jgi:enterochelin esterase-like enzyme
MNLIDQTIVVAVYPGDRMKEYTKPGYEEYARVLVTEVKPYIDTEFRTLPGRRNTIVLGSSLGGVVAFHLAWVWPQVVGNAACLSSTFSWKDDLIDRVRTDEIESRRELRVYLDSGWPHDNYEATLSMASALVERGFVLGRNIHYLAFPFARHDEMSWASRCHLPLQLFTGRLRRAAAQRALQVRGGS